MSKENTYKQCYLHHPTEGSVHIAWIPTKFAVVGRNVSIKMAKDSEWIHGWVVREVYLGSRTDTEINDGRQDHKRFEYVLGD